MCPMFVNLTDSKRIDSELRGWFHAPAPEKVRTPTLNSGKTNGDRQERLATKHELAKVRSSFCNNIHLIFILFVILPLYVNNLRY